MGCNFSYNTPLSLHTEALNNWPSWLSTRNLPKIAAILIIDFDACVKDMHLCNPVEHLCGKNDLSFNWCGGFDVESGRCELLWTR